MNEAKIECDHETDRSWSWSKVGERNGADIKKGVCKKCGKVIFQFHCKRCGIRIEDPERGCGYCVEDLERIRRLEAESEGIEHQAALG